MVEKEKKVCVKSNEEGHVSVDFYPSEMERMKKAVSKDEMYEVHEELLYLGEQIRNMIHYSQTQEEKESIHNINIVKNESIIKIYSVLKVLAIGIGLGAQFYLLRKYMTV